MAKHNEPHDMQRGKWKTPKLKVDTLIVLPLN